MKLKYILIFIHLAGNAMHNPIKKLVYWKTLQSPILAEPQEDSDSLFCEKTYEGYPQIEFLKFIDDSTIQGTLADNTILHWNIDTGQFKVNGTTDFYGKLKSSKCRRTDWDSFSQEVHIKRAVSPSGKYIACVPRFIHKNTYEPMLVEQHEITVEKVILIPRLTRNNHKNRLKYTCSCFQKWLARIFGKKIE